MASPPQALQASFGRFQKSRIELLGAWVPTPPLHPVAWRFWSGLGVRGLECVLGLPLSLYSAECRTSLCLCTAWSVVGHLPLWPPSVSYSVECRVCCWRARGLMGGKVNLRAAAQHVLCPFLLIDQNLSGTALQSLCLVAGGI